MKSEPQKAVQKANYWSKTNTPFTPRLASWSVFDVSILDERDGFISFLVEGKKTNIFANEAGSHVWQRVSGTERKGRVHTSLVTVAVLTVPSEQEVVLRDSDLTITTFCSSSAGGQHMQKNETAIRIIHKPTGLVATCQNERSQLQNKIYAMSVIRARIKESGAIAKSKSTQKERYDQIGYGERGGKTRTIRVKDNTVLCHITNRTKSLKEYLKGKIAF